MLLTNILPSKGQKESISLFNELGNRDTNSTSYFLYQLGMNPIRYNLENRNCLSLIFTKDGKFHYRDLCPHDYGTSGELGTFKIKGDTVYLKSNLNKSRYLSGYFDGSIKNILIEKLNKDTLSKVLIESEFDEFQNFKARILFFKPPKWLKFKRYSMGLNQRRRKNEQSINKIFVTSLLIAKSPFEKYHKEIFLEIMQKWRMHGKKITIELWEAPLKIVRIGNKLVLYNWNWKRKKYEKTDNLILEFEDKG